MSLSLYKKKRHFNETPEPAGKEKSSKGALRFVIQKHDASHLHYDFRLEMEGVLKSWAVPKGPSLNPEDKRLAMMVEDHPYDYRNFEGIIPEGNYGAGTVIVWDEGTYEIMDGEGLSRKEQETSLLRQLHSGSLKIVLHGKKIKGEYALFKLRKGSDEKSWMLVKKKDEFASGEDITKKNKSVKSGKTILQVARENGTEPNHPEDEVKIKISNKPVQLLYPPEGKAAKKAATKKTSVQSRSKKNSSKRSSSSAEIKRILGESISLARPSEMPADVVPMLATLVDSPFDSDQWIFEVKWDGYRAVAYCSSEGTGIISRNLKPFTEKYFPVTEALGSLGIEAVFDGEIVAVDENGLANFQMLQNWQNTPSELQFFIFDIIWLGGYDLTRIPLMERKRILREVLPADHPVVKYSDHVVGKGNEFFKVALSKGLEGIMAKKASSIYQIDTRTEDWVKIKVNQRQEVIICGFTQPRNTRKFFGALMLGVYQDDELIYVGHTGSGFNVKGLEQIYRKLQPLVVNECPFAKCPKGNMPVTWVKPRLVCEIKFTEWTKDWMARHPIFMGLRTDKKAKDVRLEKAVNMATLSEKGPAKEKKQKASPLASKAPSKKAVSTSASKKSSAKKSATPKKSSSKQTASNAKPAASRPATTGNSVSSAGPVKSVKSAKSVIPAIDLSAGEEQVITLNRQEVKLTNLNKVYWKKERFLKGDMINYYLKIAPYIMPYMMNRPQSLNRHPNGIEGPNFFQKDMKGKVPEWIATFDEFSESTNETVAYMVCNNEATLIYMANLGCIEMNPWHGRVGSTLKPDWCLIDLDPDKTNTFEQVMEVAKVVKKVLDSIGADCCVKTSGSSGIHIYIPLGAKYDYDQSKQLAELVVTLVNHEMPELTSVERSPSKRKGMIYLDFLQNRETQTAAAPYSLRPKPGVPVSTPLDWSELKKGLTPATYNAKNIFDRLKREGDLFKPVLGKGIDLEKVLSKLATQLK